MGLRSDRTVLLSVLAQKIRSLAPPPDISHVMGQIEELLDESIAAEGYMLSQRVPAQFRGSDHSVNDFISSVSILS